MTSDDGFTLELTPLEDHQPVNLTEPGTGDPLACAMTDPGSFVIPCNTYDPAMLEDATERAIEIMSIAYPVFVFGHIIFRSSVN